jgi:hypothetical protein
MPRPPLRHPGAAAVFRFHPRTGEATERYEPTQFRPRLVDAFRSGQGLRLDLELSLTSGPLAALYVRTAGPETTRWFARVLADLYLPHQWELLPSDYVGPSADSTSQIGRRIHEWPEPIGPDVLAPLLERWSATLRTTPRGACLRVRMRPLPTRAVYWWTGPPPGPATPPADRHAVDRRPGVGRFPASESSALERPSFWRVDLRLEVEPRSPAAGATADLGEALSAASRSARGNGITFHRPRSPAWARAVAPGAVTVTLDELAGFWPGRRTPVGEDVPAEAALASVLPLGRTYSGAVVGPRIEPHQGRHLAVLGQTGMGKSSLLLAVARRALSQSGAVVFDPLGDTVRSLRAELETGSERRCIWISPDLPGVELNALDGIDGGEPADPIRSERRLNDLVHALRRVRSGRYTDSGYWGPRLEEMLTRALRAAAAFPGGTLADAHTLLSTSTRLGRPVPTSAVEVVRELADRIRDRPEDADGARRLLHEVVRSPVLSRMLASSAPTLRARDLVAPGQVVLISGDAGRVGESTARYLLSVLLALVWSELLARTETPKTFVVLDEAQWFSHESLAEMLRLGRRKNVHVILATQAIASLPEPVAEAVWTNVSDIVAFRGSPEEAREMARVAPSVTPDALLSLPRGHAAVLIGKGEQVHWLRTARVPNAARPQTDPRYRPTLEPIAEVPPVSSSPAAPGEPPLELDASQVRYDLARETRVFEEIARIAEVAPDLDPFAVDLVELRRRVDPGGEIVRRVGSALARAGALVRTERSDASRQWIVDRRGFVQLISDRTAAVATERTSPTPQPS